MADNAQSDDLDRRIADARRVEGARAGGRKPSTKGYNQGSRVLMELIGAPAGGAVIGFALDTWLKTQHWLLLVFLVIGFVVGFRNVYRISKEQAE